MSKIKRRVRANQAIDKIYNSSNVLIIHYTCENVFGSADGKNPRIVTIAIRNLTSDQTMSFAIHKIAELKNISIADIKSNFNELEKEMLDEYFNVVKSHKDYIWLHWKMRDINYGFEAIEHRYKVLGGEPVIISDEKKFSLSEILKDKYGHGYIPKPRLYEIMKLNQIKKQNLLTGQAEALCLNNNEFVKLHKSMLSKVELIEVLFIKAAENSLKTEATFADRYGITPQGIFEWGKENWIGALITTIVTLIISLIAQYYTNLF